MLGDGLIRRLILTADSQPNVAFIPLYQPAVPFHHAGQVEEQQCREQEGEKQGGQAESAGHGFGLGVFERAPRQEGGKKKGVEGREAAGSGVKSGRTAGQRQPGRI